MKRILAILLLALIGCVHSPPVEIGEPTPVDYYKDIKEDEYDLYRFKDETPLPEYKRTPDEEPYYKEDRQKW
jgi:hypothetical protein